MFTGIVQGMARVVALEVRDQFVHLSMMFPQGGLDRVQTGASIALNGVCLTVTSFDGDSAQFDIIDETLDKTTLGDLAVGQEVNFERAAAFGSEIGGHLLSGHISDTAEVVQRIDTEDNCVLTLSVHSNWIDYLLPKGFVAIDGVSLTIGVVDVDRSTFQVHLIPETLRVTNLGEMRVGMHMNLELDSMTQAVVHTVRRVLSRRDAKQE
jgi:riboflavin synthase